MDKLPEVLRHYVSIVGPNFSRIPKEVYDNALTFHTIQHHTEYVYDKLTYETKQLSIQKMAHILGLYKREGEREQYATEFTAAKTLLKWLRHFPNELVPELFLYFLPESVQHPPLVPKVPKTSTIVPFYVVSAPVSDPTATPVAQTPAPAQAPASADESDEEEEEEYYEDLNSWTEDEAAINALTHQKSKKMPPKRTVSIREARALGLQNPENPCCIDN